MKYIIDTSTWIALVRYYKPFDNNMVVLDFFENKLKNNEFLLIDEVFKECSFVAQKIVVKELEFISSKKLATKTSDIYPDRKFFNLLDNQFCNKSQRIHLTEAEIDNLKSKYINSADAKIILLALKIKKEKDIEKVFVVTEETSASNDNKLFKKIPAICKEIEIESMSLPELIELFNTEIEIIIQNVSSQRTIQ